eukprot:jgi/Mesen1/11071/ME000099S10519
MGTLEFPDLGRHCSQESCQLIDFLPFKCDKCSKVFCLDHRSYAGHSCPHASSGDATVIICPLCAKSVRLVPNEDPNVTWNRHGTTSCDPSNYARATQKRKCPVAGCREVLTFSNVVRCKGCGKDTCLKHRFGPDHACPASVRKAPAGASATASSFLQSFRDRATTFIGQSAAPPIGGAASASGRGGAKMAGKPAAPKAAAKGGPGGAGAGRGAASGKGRGAGAAADPSNTVKGSAQQRQQEWDRKRREQEKQDKQQQQQQQRQAENGGVGGNGGGGGAGPSGGQPQPAGAQGSAPHQHGAHSGAHAAEEECPQCGARFNEVADLVLHVDRIHLGGNPEGPRGGESALGLAPSPRGAGAREICPTCGKSFGNVAALIHHAEREHNAQPGSQCVVS